jgi:hypothetical protein
MRKVSISAGAVLVAGVTGGALVLLMEFASGGLPSVYLGRLGAALLVSLGALLGVWIWLLEALVTKLGLVGLRRAALRSFSATPLVLFAT